MSEPEMTLERACEIMTEHGVEGLMWHHLAAGYSAEGAWIATRGRDSAIATARAIEAAAVPSIPPPTPPSIPPPTPPIERPAHYARLKLQPFDAARAWGLGLALGSAVKYIARHQHKGDPVGDLRKAINCIRDEIAAIEKGDAK